MSSTFEKVALLGATGSLGLKILKCLREAGFEVTAVQRNTSQSTVSDVRSVRVDLLDRNALASAFTGHDIVLSAVPSPVAVEQEIMLGAAIDAGVKRVVPSEFSSHLEAKARTTLLSTVAEKLNFRQIVETAASEGKITWSSINNGPSLDAGVKWGMLGPRVHESRAVFHDGGHKVVCVTSTDDIAKAVTLVLQHPAETKNKAVYVYSAAVTERQMCDLVAKLTGKQLTVVDVDVQADYDAYVASSKASQVDPGLQWSPYYLMMYGAGYGGDYRGTAMNKAIG